MFKIFIVEDDRQIADNIVGAISKTGHECRAAGNLEDILPEFTGFSPHLVLLDIVLPFYDGFYWCGRIRMLSNVPIIFISSRGSDMDIIIASNMGGDDYIVKPFSMDILLAKISALLRRTYSYDYSDRDVISHKGLIFNISNGTVSSGEGVVELTKNEAQILHILLKSRGNIASRERIIRGLWKEASFIDDNTLTVNMTRLRKKLADLGLEDYIETKKNLGYLI